MIEAVTGIFLVLMFIALYMFFIFIVLNIKNRDKLFSYPKSNRRYKVSVLIPAYNEEESINETIKHIMALDYPKPLLDIIVINDGSTDKTSEIVKSLIKKYSRLRLLDKKNSGKADSLNQGIKIANGELIAVVDSDSFPFPDALKKMVNYFDDEKIGAVTSFVSIRNKSQNILTRIQSLEYLILAWTRKMLDFIDSVYVTNGPLSVYRKEHLLKVGGFDSKSITEDIDITWNILDHGYKTAMCLPARVSTIAPSKFKPWWRQRIRWGIGGFQVISKFKKSFFKKGIFGAFILPYVSLSIILGVFVFSFSFYLFLKDLFIMLLTAGYYVAAETSLFQIQSINFYPSVMIFYFLVLFSVSMIYYNYILQKAQYEYKLGVKRFFNLVFYMFVFLTLYPVVWFAAGYRFIKGDFRW